MPRAGGEADKWGNRYEALWTVDSVLDVLFGDAQTITVEPLTDGQGVEFVKERHDGSVEFHSVKRQTTGNAWTLYNLTAIGKTGRSILQDLFEKLLDSSSHEACFVSATTPNLLEEIRSLAEASPDVGNFLARLNAQAAIKAEFEKYLLGICKTVEISWELLRRLRVVGVTESELRKRLEHRIRHHVYSPSGNAVNPKALRLTLGEAVLGWLGRPIKAPDVRQLLADHDLFERDWQRDPVLWEIVDSRNLQYAQGVEAELIHGEAIQRDEVRSAVAALLSESQRDVCILGTAGLGKSCTLSQVARELTTASIPFITLRLDSQTVAVTADGLGREMGLPTSPAIALAGMANGRRCVLVIDQLDSLSVASGRNQHLWQVFEELLAQRCRYPQMRMLLACREFDACHDHRLKRLLSDSALCLEIRLSPLSIDCVRAAVAKTGMDPLSLSTDDLALLQTPQNLSLFLQGDPTRHGSIGSVQSLLDRYWTHKQERVGRRLGAPSNWYEVVHRLAGWLSDQQTLSAPADILDPWLPTAQAMASEHVLVKDGRRYRFFHESVFDYAYSRTYVATGGSASSLLLNTGSEQHLFRRAQVRQVLTYQRDRDFGRYLDDLGRLLIEPAVRSHIKKLVLDWLRSLPDPKAEEWSIVCSLEQVEPCDKWWRGVPHNSIAWFDLLHKNGTWREWLQSGDSIAVDQAIWLLSQKQVMEERSAKVAQLFEPLVDDSPLSRRRLRALIGLGEFHHSGPMLSLVLNAIGGGSFDDFEDGDLYLHDFPARAGLAAADLLAALVDRFCIRFPSGNPFDQKRGGFVVPHDYCWTLAEHAPEAFLSRLLPRIEAEISRRPKGEEGLADEIWPYLSLGLDHDFASQLLTGLREAMRKLAKTHPDRLRQLTKDAVNHRSQTLAFLLLGAWCTNPEEFADEFCEYVSMYPHRLTIGYALVGRGDGRAAVSREAIMAMSRYCSENSYMALENAILALRTSYEEKHPQVRGREQLGLLECLPPQRYTQIAAQRHAELRRKFPSVEIEPPRPIEVVSAASPISDRGLSKMNDEQWFAAMRKYQFRVKSGYREFLKGGMHELCGELIREAQGQKERFASLLLQMPADFSEHYFEAILRGISQTNTDGVAGRFDLTAIARPLDRQLLLEAIRRVNSLPGKPCRRAICDIIEKCGSEGGVEVLPIDMIEMLCDFALNDPDPEDESWRSRDGSIPMYGGDALVAGINSVRGRAAWAIGKLLFADRGYWSSVRRAVESLCRDTSTAVRSCALTCTLALLNIDRDEAVRLFLILAEDGGEALGRSELDNFLHHAVGTHYKELRSQLLSLLSHQAKGARRAAAAQIVVASASFLQEAQEDVAHVLRSDPDCRAAAAGVFAYNLDQGKFGVQCSDQLRVLFSDPDKTVREAASRCFREIGDSDLSPHEALISDYLDSPAFEDGATHLVHALEESTSLLPDVVCGIPERLLERGLNSSRQAPSFRDWYLLPELVLRLYRQTVDETIKSRCLDIVDRLLESGVNGVESELLKVER